MLQHPAFGYQLPECNRTSRVRYLVLLFIVQRHFARASGNSHLGAETREKETSKEGWIRITLHSQGRCFHQLTHWGLGICQCSLKDCSNYNFCLTPWLSRLHLMLFVVCADLGGGEISRKGNTLSRLFHLSLPAWTMPSFQAEALGVASSHSW